MHSKKNEWKKNFFFTLGIDVSDVVEVEYEPDEDPVIEAWLVEGIGRRLVWSSVIRKQLPIGRKDC